MNTPTPPAFYRSEAFAEDLGQSGAEREEAAGSDTPRWAGLLPLAVALAGLAFAVLPPAH